MNLSALLVLFLAGSIPAIGATPQLQRNTTVQDSVEVSAQPKTPPSSPELFSRENGSHFYAENWELEKNTGCYKMRSYHVVREDQDSDMTRMDGYTTCQPATKYQTKRTVLDQP